MLGFVLTVDFEYGDSLTDFWFRIYNKRSDKRLDPVLSDEFIEKLKVIFKAYLIVFKLNMPMKQLGFMSFSFSYTDYTLECKIERR